MAFALGTTAGAGTISIVAGGTVVTGVGTAFAAANIGSILVVGTQWGIISTVTSTTSITIDRPFTTAVTVSAYTRSANIPIITQSGTDTSLSGLTGVPGVTVSPTVAISSPGTVSVTAGSSTVTGVGTSFAASQIGLTLTVGTQFGIVAAVASTTSLTLDRTFATAVSGSTYVLSATPIVWTITSALLAVTGSLTINRLTNRLRFLNSANFASSAGSCLQVSATGTFNNSVSQTINSYSFHSPNYSILFESTATTNSGVGNFIGTYAGSTSVFEGNIEFNMVASQSPQTIVLEGTTTLQNGAFINASVAGANVQFTSLLSASILTVNNWAGYGCGMRVTGNTTNINSYISVGAAGAINQSSSSAVNNPIYAGLQDLGNNPSFRTVNNSLKYFQLLNFVSNRDSATLGVAVSGSSTLNSQTLITNSLNVNAIDTNGVVQNMKLWAKDSNNGSRCTANYGVGLGFEIATTNDLTYTGVTNSLGTASFSSIISAIFWQPISGSATLTCDFRGNGGSTSQNLIFFACSYNHNLAQNTPDMWAFNSTTNLFNTTASKTANYLLLADTSITQTTMATVAAYTTLNTTQQTYDYAKYYLYTNFVGQTATYVTRSGNTINAGSYNVIIDDTAATPFVFASSTITIKSSSFTGSLTTSGTVTLANNAVFSNNTVTANVSQATPTNLTGVTITGNLTYSTNTPITITLTNCAISGTVSNSGTGTVTISLSGSTIGTVGTRVTTRLVTALTLNGLTAGSQVYVADGSGTQIDYVASSSTSYTLNTTGYTGTWTWKVARYGYTSQSGTHSPAFTSTTVSVTLATDLYITQATKATVAAYTTLENPDKMYDYAAYYETTNAGIPLTRIVSKQTVNSNFGSYDVVMNNFGGVWSVVGNTITMNTTSSFVSGVTMTGGLITTGNVTLQAQATSAGTYAPIAATNITFNNLVNYNTVIASTSVSNLPTTGDISLGGAISFGTTSNLTLTGTTNITNTAVLGTIIFNNATNQTVNLSNDTGALSLSATNPTVTVIGLNNTPLTLVTAGTNINSIRQTTITAPNLLIGSRVQLYDTTNNIELYNGVLSSALNLTYTYSGNINVRLRATYQSGTTAYLPLETVGIVTSNGASFQNSQSLDTVYNSNAIDGSTVTGVTADTSNIFIDLTGITTITIQSLYAWYVYESTTAIGISNFFNGILANDTNNYKIDVSILNIKLFNVSTAPITITGGYLFRSDATTIIAAASNSIQMDPAKAYLASSGDITSKLNLIIGLTA